MSTFSRQKELPRLPVPNPKETFAKYLVTAQPYLSKAEMERVKGQVETFLKSEELVKRQSKLEALAKEKDSWLEEMWLKGAYLSWRAALCINSNVVGYLLMKDKFIAPQGFSAAAITVGMLKFHIGLLEGTVPTDMARDKPQCMDQFTRMFSMNRVPGKEIDMLKKYSEEESRHIVVSAGHRFYKISVLGGTNGREIISVPELYAKMNAILQEMRSKPYDPFPVGTLTAVERTFAATAREKLIAASPKNAQSLHDIESALFVVCLEDGVDRTDTEIATTALHGKGRSRWFDKSFNVIVKEDGNPSLLVEHSWADAPVPLSGFFNHALPFAEKLPRCEPASSVQKPQEIRFVMNPEVQAEIRKAEKEVDEAIADSDAKIVMCTGLGKPIWKEAKLSPDAAVQMAMQLAYRRLHGTTVATYETIGMPTYLHGRTEACRVVSNESEAFVHSMMTGYLITRSEQDRTAAEKALRSACDQHIRYITQGQQGKGIDRHMLGLRLMSEDGSQPEIFKDETFTRTGSTGCWILSTSNNSYIPRSFGGLFGTVMPNGYGVCYIPVDRGVLLCVESKASCPTTNSDAFIAMVNECLMDIATIAGVPIPRSML